MCFRRSNYSFMAGSVRKEEELFHRRLAPVETPDYPAKAILCREQWIITSGLLYGVYS